MVTTWSILGHVSQMAAYVIVGVWRSSSATRSGRLFCSCFILRCLGNCGNPDELSFLYLRISFSSLLSRNTIAFCFGYRHSCISLRFSQNNIPLLKHWLMRWMAPCYWWGWGESGQSWGSLDWYENQISCGALSFNIW